MFKTEQDTMYSEYYSYSSEGLNADYGSLKDDNNDTHSKRYLWRKREKKWSFEKNNNNWTSIFISLFV